MIHFASTNLFQPNARQACPQEPLVKRLPFGLSRNVALLKTTGKLDYFEISGGNETGGTRVLSKPDCENSAHRYPFLVGITNLRVAHFHAVLRFLALWSLLFVRAGIG